MEEKGFALNTNSMFVFGFCAVFGFSVSRHINKNVPPPHTHTRHTLDAAPSVLPHHLRLCLICLHKHSHPPLLSSFISSLSSIFYGRRNGNVGGVFSLRLRVSFTEEIGAREARLTQGRSGPTVIGSKINGAHRSSRRSVRTRRGAEVRLQQTWDCGCPRSGTRRPADQREDRHREQTWPT